MSATSSPAQGVAVTAPEAAFAPSAACIDASCRPVLLLFLSAAAWLVASSLLGLIASLKFHSPEILADCSWLTYGRVHPGAVNGFLYGFAMQAGLGVVLWLLCHQGRATLATPTLVIAGWLLWNTGVTAGIVGILYGDSTGQEWLEMPRYGSSPMFFGYLTIAFVGLLSFHHRAKRDLSISQWFLVAALFWFPWIYITARLLLVHWQVRGVMQAVIDWWYTGNLATIWLGFIGLGASFHLIPKLANRPLHSHYLGVFIFWMLAFFGSWGGVPVAAPVPAWMPAMSAFTSMLVVVPILAVLVNIYGTLGGKCSIVMGNPLLMFMGFGAGAWLVSAILGAIGSLAGVGEITNFTWFDPARAAIALYGFFAMTMFGAIYYILPQLVPAAPPCPRLLRAHLWLSMIGIVLYAAPLAVGGVLQGMAMNDASVPFLKVVSSSLLFLRASTTGELLMVLGNVLLLLNLAGILVRAARTCITAGLSANRATAEVAS
jgi:cytochrome c oxidase cbb3-type subunit 1